MMTVFLAIGGVGVLLLALTLVLGDHVHGVFEVLETGDWLSGAGLAGFLGALGFVGALVLDQTDNLALASVAGVLAGLAVGALVAWVTIRLRGSATGEAPSGRALVGASGVVITAIPAGGYGQVRCDQGGHLTTLNARAEHELPAGTEVWIAETLSPTSVLVQPTRP